MVKDGFVVHAWGDQSKRSDWMSSAKPVLSTLLLFALQEGLIESVDQPVADFDSRLTGKDRDITFRHLGSMTSGFRRLERPGSRVGLQRSCHSIVSTRVVRQGVSDRSP